jgi:tol-pal system protein YbgF
MNAFRSSLAAVAICGMMASSLPARATDNKNMIELQVQLQQLQDTLARMQQNEDERWALSKAMLDANTTSLMKMSAAVAWIQSSLAAQQEAGGGKLDQIAGQVQSVHDSIDELRAHIARLEKTLNDLQAQAQNISSAPPAGATVTSDAGAGQPAATAPVAAAPAPAAATAATAPPVHDLYESAYRDYSGGRYDLAGQEFTQVVQAYPQDDLAGAAQFYIGEIAYKHGKYHEAAQDYQVVIDQYPGSEKAAAAELRRGEALVQTGERTEGIRSLRRVIQRYPQSPEAAQAKTHLTALGVPVTPKPSAATQ